MAPEGRLYRAIADPTRRLLLDTLMAGERTAGQLAETCPGSRPSISKHLRLLKVIASTEENLQSAFESENTVSDNVYPPMIAQAMSDGNRAAVIGFSHARDAEEVHAKLYKKVIGHMVADEDPTYYVCKVCGFVVDGEPPDTCPVCNAPKKVFFEVE